MLVMFRASEQSRFFKILSRSERLNNPFQIAQNYIQEKRKKEKPYYHPDSVFFATSKILYLLVHGGRIYPFLNTLFVFPIGSRLVFTHATRFINMGTSTWLSPKIDHQMTNILQYWWNSTRENLHLDFRHQLNMQVPARLCILQCKNRGTE